MDPFQEKTILKSWQRNADAWVLAVREQQIESRRLLTDAAIVKAVQSVHPETVLDIGCGEGWLARELSQSGVDVLGIDAIDSLVIAASEAGGGRFHCMDYGSLIDGQLTERFDAAVCNFSLFGQQNVDQLICHLPGQLNPGGSLIIQTLHPYSACGQGVYQDGWREGSWQGFGEAFRDPAPWYFRTLASWLDLFNKAGFVSVTVQEPVIAGASLPASLILTGVFSVEKSA